MKLVTCFCEGPGHSPGNGDMVSGRVAWQAMVEQEDRVDGVVGYGAQQVSCVVVSHQVQATAVE